MLALKFLVFLTGCGVFGSEVFPPSMQESFLKYVNAMRYVVGASDMRKLRWDSKVEKGVLKKVESCSMENEHSMGYAKMAMDLAVFNVTIEEKAYPDLDIALVSWWRGQKTEENFICPDDDDFCMYSAHMSSADSETIACAYSLCQKFTFTTKEYSFLKPVLVLCEFENNGYFVGQRTYTKGRKCDMCPISCVDKLWCDTPPSSYGLRGYRTGCPNGGTQSLRLPC